MTKDSLIYVSKIVEKYKIGGRVLDVGARQVNYPCTDGDRNKIIYDSCPKRFFDDYTGLDMIDGRNVDVVASSHKIPLKDRVFDCVMTIDMLEHDDDPFQTAKEMMRVLKKEGYAIVIAPFYFPVHNYPDDYFRYTTSGLKLLFKDLECLEEEMTVHHSRVVMKKI